MKPAVPASDPSGRGLPLMAWLAACAAAGAAAPLGWAPSGWWHVAIAGYAVLALCAARTRHVGSAGLAGLAFGLGLHLTGHGWAYEALHRQAGVPVPAAAAATLRRASEGRGDGEDLTAPL